MKLAFYDDFRLGVVQGNHIVDVPQVVENQTTLKPNELKIKTQIQKLSNLRANRDSSLVESSLRRLNEALPSSSTNIMPLILVCAEAYATLGEISDVLRESFGEYKN